MIGALAVACFVKVCGAAFLGEARSEAAGLARESPPSMIAPMAILAAACALIGIAPALLPPVLDSALAAWNGGASRWTGSGALPSVGALAPLVPVSLAASGFLVAAVAVAVGLAWAVRRNNLRGARRPSAAPSGECRRVPTWDCGYARPTSRMQYTASSFARGIVVMFAWVLRPEPEPGRLSGPFPGPTELRGEVDEAVLDRALLPALRKVEGLSRWTHRFQAGLTQQYVLYILAALAALLVSLVPFDAIFALLAAK
jgi:NADH:ubiquinone oxidoreductase subunit 5 (subunit L)/multisubunit Na+/H+ antiporter MnhA subunit